MVEALRAECRLCEILPVAGMAKSSYEYARNARAEGETEEHAAARKAVIEASGASGGTCGCRRIYAQASDDAEDGAAIGECTVRSIMKEENLVARAARKKRRYSSYEGEISEAPENLLRDERGRHHFHADKPNELWITDVTEFRIPAGKCTSRRRSIASTECPSAGPSARPRTRCLPTHRSCGPARSLRMVSTTGCTPTAAAITGGPVGSPSAMGTASCARWRGRGAHPTIQGRRASSAG